MLSRMNKFRRFLFGLGRRRSLTWPMVCALVSVMLCASPACDSISDDQTDMDDFDLLDLLPTGGGDENTVSPEPPDPDEPDTDQSLAPKKGPPAGGRTPQWPLKTQRKLYTPAQIMQAQLLVNTVPAAIGLKNSILSRANYWLTVPDEQLHLIIPDQRVPRAVDVSASSIGCPVHGTAVYSHGTYPWILDKERPYQIKCPIGQEVYPSNDFVSYYQSGMNDPSLLTGTHADNGYGWQHSSGAKYWFVAYAAHWHFRSTFVPAAQDLARAYALTGNRDYARKAIVILDRIAATYPLMNYRTQSRDSLTTGPKPGKILNSFWEALLVRDLVMAYDLVFETLVGSNPISLPWRTSLEIRQNIEANLMEEAFDAYDSIDIDGNYGNHQSCLVHTAIVRNAQAGIDRMIDRVFRVSGVVARYEGFDYALYNLVFKDGLPYETAPFYNGVWVTNFGLITEVAPLAGIDPFSYERMPRIFDAPLDLLCAQQFTPSNGDSGSVYSQEMLPHVDAYESAYRAIRRQSYAWTLYNRGALTDPAYQTFPALFVENIDAEAIAAAVGYDPVHQSRVLDGYGMAILNNSADTAAVSMYYGIRGNHGHKDRLNIELFANGSRISPDLGYPDFANSTTPGRFAWTSNTISHNTVVVDGVPQTGNDRAHVLRFHKGNGVSLVDVDARTSYPNTTQYRRQLVFVDVGQNAYLVDVFRVAGGGNHVLSLHGHEGTFSLTGATLAAVNAQGTLAGPTTGYGENNSQPPGPPNYNTFMSGYSFLYNWQNAIPNAVVTAHWSHLDGSMLRAHVAPNDGQELVVADARVSPLLKIPTILKYVLLRRMADADGTCFVTVWELANSPIITGPVTVSTDAALGAGADHVAVVTVPRGAYTDLIAVAPAPGTTYSLESGLTSDAAVCMVSKEGATIRRILAAGGTHVTGAQSISIPATLTGTIATVNYANKTITVNTGDSTVNAASLVGKSVRIYNAMHGSLWTIGSASRSGTVLTLTLSGAEVFTGRIKPTQIFTSPPEVRTTTSTLYPSDMPGMYLVTRDLAYAHRIESTNSYQRYFLAAGTNMTPFSNAVSNGDYVWIADFGVGDTVEIERVGDAQF